MNAEHEITKARTLLGQFEAQLDRPEGLVPLSEALAILADVRDEAASEPLTRLASNIVLAYATKLQAVFESLGEMSPAIHNETLSHWYKVYSEFKDSGFAMPENLDYLIWKILLDKETLGKFSRASPEKRKAFLEGLFGEKAPKLPGDDLTS